MLLDRARLICALLLSQLVVGPFSTITTAHPLPSENEQQQQLSGAEDGTAVGTISKRSPGLWKNVAVGAAIGVGGALLYHAYKKSKSGGGQSATVAPAADDAGTDTDQQQPANLRRG